MVSLVFYILTNKMAPCQWQPIIAAPVLCSFYLVFIVFLACFSFVTVHFAVDLYIIHTSRWFSTYLDSSLLLFSYSSGSLLITGSLPHNQNRWCYPWHPVVATECINMRNIYSYILPQNIH